MKRYLGNNYLFRKVSNQLHELSENYNLTIFDLIHQLTPLDEPIINFEEPNKNIFRAINQLKIYGPKNNRIPDFLVFINGVSIVIFELKSILKSYRVRGYRGVWIDQMGALMPKAKLQIKKYSRDIPELFKYLLFCITSDYKEIWYGAINKWYGKKWSEINLDSFLENIFNPNKLLGFIKNYIYFSDSYYSDVVTYKDYCRIEILIRYIESGVKEIFISRIRYWVSLICLIKNIFEIKTELQKYAVIWITGPKDQFLYQKCLSSLKFLTKDISQNKKNDLKENLLERSIYFVNITEFLKNCCLMSNQTNLICISKSRYKSIILWWEKLKFRLNNFFQIDLFNSRVDNLKNSSYLEYLKTAFPGCIHINFSFTKYLLTKWKVKKN
ncbi:hypothetical protein OVS_02485 [Mycoplasma ovis str. Michigan]|uniref:type I site-specific deoxyribonuclease n=1 Tax=Mycoplasma ovis str. Michigan TaxID=1415773 RepID=A0ABM5P1H7_9MOLU|nr:type I restriction endonuclease [Mycoplasma ovis]AHC40335.1 hypothetical protein OVS_02485 [Mycoplasma ovis str. Michigan]